MDYEAITDLVWFLWELTKLLVLIAIELVKLYIVISLLSMIITNLWLFFILCIFTPSFVYVFISGVIGLFKREK